MYHRMVPPIISPTFPPIPCTFCPGSGVRTVIKSLVYGDIDLVAQLSMRRGKESVSKGLRLADFFVSTAGMATSLRSLEVRRGGLGLLLECPLLLRLRCFVGKQSTNIASTCLHLLFSHTSNRMSAFTGWALRLDLGTYAAPSGKQHTSLMRMIVVRKARLNHKTINRDAQGGQVHERGPNSVTLLGHARHSSLSESSSSATLERALANRRVFLFFASLGLSLFCLRSSRLMPTPSQSSGL
jgi:hypothetical protein